jgi:hypothetical protein
VRLYLVRKDPASGDTNCPALYATDRESYVVVGRPVPVAELDGLTAGVASDEVAVEVPAGVLRETGQA